MKTVSALMASLIRDERGATAIEYTLVGTLIAMIVFAAVGFVGNGTDNLLNYVSSTTSETFSNSSNLLN